MIDTQTGNLKQLNPKEGDVLKCVERCHNWWTVGKEYSVTSDGTPADDDGQTYGMFSDPQPLTIFTLVTPYRVPVGYTGKLKDMDLREGDVVYHHIGCQKYTFKNGHVGLLTVADSFQDYTLISRANTKPWSNWKMSCSQGKFKKHPNREYETHALPDTDQVTYRWREVAVKEPAVTTRTNTLYFYGHGAEFETTLIDGVPNFTTTRLVNPNTPS